MRKPVKFKFIVPALAKSISLLLGNRNKGKYEISLQDGLPNQFFILGSGRNGSTLLATLLNYHQNIYVPPEQYSLPYSIFKWHLFRFYSWKKMMDIFLRDLKLSNANWELTDKDEVELREILFSMPDPKRKISNAFTMVLDYYGKKEVKELLQVGEQSPLMTDFSEQILAEFPKAKFIFLVRDPRDVILSYSKMKGSGLNGPKAFARKWNNSVDVYQKFKSIASDRLILIKYESIVSNTSETMNEICKFLNVPFDESIMQHGTIDQKESDPRRVNTYDHHRNLYKPVFTNSIEKWKKELTNEILEEISPIVMENAVKLGYVFD